MITEKKKRTPKPAKNQATTDFFDFVFPLMACRDADILESASGLTGHFLMGVPPGSMFGNKTAQEHAAGILSAWEKDVAISEYFRVTRELIREMILHVTAYREDRGITEPMKAAINAIPARIRPVIRLCGGGKIECGPEPTFSMSEPHEKRLPEGFRAVALWLTAEALSSGAGAYVGGCPRCGKIFEKKRGDQEYCGKACKAAALQKKYYDEKKQSSPIDGKR